MLALFVIQNAIMYSVVGAILLVAAFGIYNIISTVVYEKTRDIAILKSLGFTERDIQAIFLTEGLIVGLLGAFVGAFVGLGADRAAGPDPLRRRRARDRRARPASSSRARPGPTSPAAPSRWSPRPWPP